MRRYERDEQIPDERTLVALADALGVQPHDLLRKSILDETRLLFACRIDEHDPDQWYLCALEHDDC